MTLDEMFAHWDNYVRPGLLETIGKFDDSELDHVPYDGSWTVGQIIAHIGGAEDFWFRQVVTREVEDTPPDPVLTTVAEAVSFLDGVHAHTRSFLAGQTMDDLQRQIEAPWGARFPLSFVIWHVIEHEVHHRGELSLILGTLGREGLDV
jgi:uncharacterized damage-inducible protein DinB